jgi:hypothetical protein
MLLKDLIKDIESKEENSFNKKKSEVNLIIDDIKVVAKSYPTFFSDLLKVGISSSFIE